MKNINLKAITKMINDSNLCNDVATVDMWKKLEKNCYDSGEATKETKYSLKILNNFSIFIYKSAEDDIPFFTIQLAQKDLINNAKNLKQRLEEYGYLFVEIEILYTNRFR